MFGSAVYYFGLLESIVSEPFIGYRLLLFSQHRIEALEVLRQIARDESRGGTFP
jgi:hypothetical protein